MNFTKNFKWQLVVVALGASLLLTGKAYSQEIDNTNFDTPATSVGGNFNSNAPAAVNTTAANPQAVSTPATGAAIRVSNEVGELGVASFPLAAGPVAAIAILGIGYLIVRRISAAKRSNWQSTRDEHAARKTSLTQKAEVVRS